MKRIRLEVAYDGTGYCGWQRQKNFISVQEVVEQALTSLLGEEITLTGASRTDSGVHAMGNVAVFETESRIPADKISYALNQRLPGDIRIQDSGEVPECFHPRYDAKRKIYCYRILNSTFPVPTLRLYSHFFYVPLDVRKMETAGACLKGVHDFKGFCSAAASVKSTVREIYRLDIRKRPLLDGKLFTGRKQDEAAVIEIEVEGNGFLYNMVRIIAGTLIKAGTGEFGPERVARALEEGDRALAGPTAPARGLTLMKILY